MGGNEAIYCEQSKNNQIITCAKYVKRWYLFYSEQFIKLRQPVAEVEEANRQQLADELEMPIKFALIPLYHHIEIITKCHSLQEAFFYINQIIEGNWSRGRLEDEIKGDLFARQVNRQNCGRMVAKGYLQTSRSSDLSIRRSC